MPSVDGEMLDLMQLAGFTQVLLALESPSARVRRDMGKWDDNEGVVRIIRGCIERGIRPWIFLMHSFPTEREEDFQELLHFVDGWRREEFADVLSWAFRLADVQIGEIDQDFVSRFDLEILDGAGKFDVPQHWTVFGQEPRWRSRWVNEDVRVHRQRAIDEHLAAWATGSIDIYYPGKEVGQAFQPDKAQSQAGKPDLQCVSFVPG